MGLRDRLKGLAQRVRGAEVDWDDEVLGDGLEAQPGRTLTVHYTGWLEDGTQFDSSRDQVRAFEFRLGAGRVIEGWERGLVGMCAGGKRKLTIPGPLAYGSSPPSNKIPPNATLIFEIELLKVR